MRIILLMTVVFLVGCDSKTAPQTPPNTEKPAVASTLPVDTEPDLHEIAVGYQQFDKITAQPVRVDSRIAAMCRGVSVADVEASRKMYGPHSNTAVMIYMNDLASGNFGKSAEAYPVGSVIVKEKKWLGNEVFGKYETAAGRDGVGGMIKREPGYDPQHGDWEFFYFEDPAKIQSGKIESCVACHAGAAGTDHVFGTWAKRR